MAFVAIADTIRTGRIIVSGIVGALTGGGDVTLGEAVVGSGAFWIV